MKVRLNFCIMLTLRLIFLWNFQKINVLNFFILMSKIYKFRTLKENAGI